MARPDILHLGARPQKDTVVRRGKNTKIFPHVKVMRSIPVMNEQSVTVAQQCAQCADLLLLDTYSEADAEFGATGKTHNWEISLQITQSVTIPVILAGGLGTRQRRRRHPQSFPFGVDSKTRTDKTGSNVKDLEKVAAFVKK